MEREQVHIRVQRLNGELLEVPLTVQEDNKLELISDLKQCLAKNDPRISPVGQVVAVVYHSFGTRIPHSQSV